jgi:hypothetical protein
MVDRSSALMIDIEIASGEFKLWKNGEPGVLEKKSG